VHSRAGHRRRRRTSIRCGADRAGACQSQLSGEDHRGEPMSTRIGVVGVGRIGRMPARNIAQEDGVDELVLIGRSEEKLEDAKAQLRSELSPDAGPELRGAHAPAGAGRIPVISTMALAEDWTDGLDGVIIASSTHTHPALARTAPAAGGPVRVAE